jgi:hypothetical protein
MPSGVVRDDDVRQSVLNGSHTFFRSTRLGPGYGHLVVLPTAQPSGIRYQFELECDRVDVAGGWGVCLSADRGMNTTYWAQIFDSTFRPTRRVRLMGIPSRVRLSHDGRLAAITVFVSGHSYSQGAFSTQTTLIDTQTAETLADLETFEVLREGRTFKSADFNFWGVTFAQDSKSFYATLGTGGRVFLVRGDATTRRAEVLREGVECPSVSPDDRFIAFKKRIGGGTVTWRLAVLDLVTSEERLVEGESRSIDDQVEWLDDRRILYAAADERPGRSGTSIWVVDVTRGESTLWSDGAYSPAVVN